MSRLPALLLSSVLLLGCGGAPDVARGVVNSGRVVLVETDVLVAAEYRRAAEQALEDSESLAAYRTTMEPYDDVEAGLRASREALDTLAALVDVWDELAADEFGEALASALDAFEGLLAVLRIAGVEPPDSLYSFLSTPRSL